ncbi:MAG: hypothetical protein R3C05_29255 [Pirellulaceae bacterium]
MRFLAVIPVLCASIVGGISLVDAADTLMAGVGKVDITEPTAGPAHDRMYARALVISDGTTKAAIITVDAVAIGGIGYIRDDYLPKVRGALQTSLGIDPQHVMANASHCHGIVRRDAAELTVQAVQQAAESMVPVHVGVSTGHEDRIMENRRLMMSDGRQIDVRHAYSLPPDDEVADVGPIDPQIGVLRLDAVSGETVAIVYNFACHPIQGVPGGANTADLTGIASTVIEENLGDSTVALFVQGCAGDINPIDYKHTDHPRHARTLGNMLALSTLKAVREATPRADKRFQFIQEKLELPRADVAQQIADMQIQRERLVSSLTGTSLNLKTYLPLMVKYHLDDQFPSYYSHRYLHDDKLQRQDMRHLDAENRRNMQAYTRNIHTMEKITRLNTNLALLKKHQAEMLESGKRTIDVELLGLRIGDFVMTTFPGELTVRIGLNIKEASPHPNTFVAGYTNGYIYYAPTAEQLRNVGGAQEDSDCILAPQWQAIYEAKAAEILSNLIPSSSDN